MSINFNNFGESLNSAIKMSSDVPCCHHIFMNLSKDFTLAYCQEFFLHGIWCITRNSHLFGKAFCWNICFLVLRRTILSHFSTAINFWLPKLINFRYYANKCNYNLRRKRTPDGFKYNFLQKWNFDLLQFWIPLSYDGV